MRVKKIQQTELFQRSWGNRARLSIEEEDDAPSPAPAASLLLSSALRLTNDFLAEPHAVVTSF